MIPFPCSYRKNSDFFFDLVHSYSPSLDRDPTFREEVDRIGVKYLGIQPPRRRQAGIFSTFSHSFTHITSMSQPRREKAKTLPFLSFTVG